MSQADNVNVPMYDATRVVLLIAHRLQSPHTISIDDIATVLGLDTRQVLNHLLNIDVSPTRNHVTLDDLFRLQDHYQHANVPINSHRQPEFNALLEYDRDIGYPSNHKLQTDLRGNIASNLFDSFDSFEHAEIVPDKPWTPDTPPTHIAPQQPLPAHFQNFIASLPNAIHILRTMHTLAAVHPNQPYRLYQLAKLIHRDSKDFVNDLAKAGVVGKGSALATITPGEIKTIVELYERLLATTPQAAEPASTSSTPNSTPQQRHKWKRYTIDEG